jgi:general secretion pathway protein J
MRSPGNAPDTGFTLPEVLIALALLAVVASLLVEAIASTRLALQATNRQGADTAVSGAQAVLRRLMTEARSVLDPSQQLDPNRAFIGATDRVSFVSSFVPQGQFGGLWRYDLVLDQEGAAAVQAALVLGQRLLRPATTSSAVATVPSTKSVLLKGVRELRLRYFGVLGTDRTPRWHDTWQHPSGLPLLISVDLVFAPSDQRQWTTLVVAPSL